MAEVVRSRASRRCAFAHIVIAAALFIIPACSSSPSSPSKTLTVSSLTPNSGSQGTTLTITVDGNNFTTGQMPTVSVTGQGLTVTSVNVLSATSLSLTMTIAADAPLGPHTVTVTSGTTSSSLTFTVTGAAPTISALSVPSGLAGTTVSETVTGTNFQTNGTTLAVSGTGVTVTGVSVASSTSLTVTFAIDPGAASGARQVTVTTADGTSAPVTFTVGTTPPAIGSFTATPSTVTIGA